MAKNREMRWDESTGCVVVSYNANHALWLTRDDIQQINDLARNVAATIHCPHCGKDQPHQHFIDKKGNASPSETSGEGQIVPWKFTIKRLTPTKYCPEGKFDKIIVRIGEWESEVPIKFLRISEVKNLEIMFEKVFAARPTETPQEEK